MSGCGAPRLPHPVYVGHPTSALREVPYTPPPALVEFVPDAPSATAVWVDGEWHWNGGRWRWKRGRWLEAPDGARYSPWTETRGADGTLYHATGVWSDVEGNPIDEPEALALAVPSAAQVVNALGEHEDVGIIQERGTGQRGPGRRRGRGRRGGAPPPLDEQWKLPADRRPGNAPGGGTPPTGREERRP